MNEQKYLKFLKLSNSIFEINVDNDWTIILRILSCIPILEKYKIVVSQTMQCLSHILYLYFVISIIQSYRLYDVN